MSSSPQRSLDDFARRSPSAAQAVRAVRIGTEVLTRLERILSHEGDRSRGGNARRNLDIMWTSLGDFVGVMLRRPRQRSIFAEAGLHQPPERWRDSSGVAARSRIDNAQLKAIEAPSRCPRTSAQAAIEWYIQRRRQVDLLWQVDDTGSNVEDFRGRIARSPGKNPADIRREPGGTFDNLLDNVIGDGLGAWVHVQELMKPDHPEHANAVARLADLDQFGGMDLAIELVRVAEHAMVRTVRRSDAMLDAVLQATGLPKASSERKREMSIKVIDHACDDMQPGPPFASFLDALSERAPKLYGEDRMLSLELMHALDMGPLSGPALG